MKDQDIPFFTRHELRALFYIRNINMERPDEKPGSISELSEESDWASKYYTRAWKRLEPRGLVNRVHDGKKTRLELTDKGKNISDRLLKINEVLDQ